MQMGMIGLGRMGGNMVRRLTRGGHTRVVYDAQASAVDARSGNRRGGADSEWRYHVGDAVADVSRAARRELKQ
jgi:6-phosphogluconate dehydrogenase (decarboxylating)